MRLTIKKPKKLNDDEQDLFNQLVEKFKELGPKVSGDSFNDAGFYVPKVEVIIL